ncbi:MAG: ABC transporter permease [Thermoprotei archaeon]|mgnify:CR=1 FL=1
MRLIVVKRVKTSSLHFIGIPVLSILIGLVISTLIFASIGVPPDLFIKEIISGFQSPQTLRYFALLTILGVALMMSFRASIWNIGAEGQMIWGMLAGGYVALFVAARSMYVSPSELPSYASMPGVEVLDASPVKPVISILLMDPTLGKLLMVLFGMLAGGLWALIPALLKAYLDIDEVATTLILNYVAYQLFNHLVSYNLRGLSVQARQFFRTDRMNSALLFNLIPGTSVTVQEAVMAVIFFVAIVLIYRYTTIGLRLKIIGSNPQLLRSVGVDERKYILLAMFLSGMLAGAAGVSISANPGIGKLEKIANVVSPPTMNLGYTAILVSWLSMLDIKLVPIYAYVVASLFQGSSLLQSEINTLLPELSLTGAALTYVPIGSILIVYVVLRVFADYSIRVRR